MANKTKIREMAKLLGIQVIADKKFDLKESEDSNLEYLQFVFEKELDARRQNSIAKIRKASNLPTLVFDNGRLHEGIQYQVSNLLLYNWIEQSKNLLIIGECMSGKTTIAAHLAESAIDKEFKVFYLKLEELLLVIKNKDTLKKAKATFNRIRNIDLLVLDEFFYLDQSREDLALIYKTLMGINETTSIIFISNREPSEWIAGTEDKYTMQLLIQRAIASSEVIKL